MYVSYVYRYIHEYKYIYVHTRVYTSNFEPHFSWSAVLSTSSGTS